MVFVGRTEGGFLIDLNFVLLFVVFCYFCFNKGIHNYYYDPCYFRCGTLPYLAPEVLTGRYYAVPADLWSCGIILVAMLTGGESTLGY